MLTKISGKENKTWSSDYFLDDPNMDCRTLRQTACRQVQHNILVKCHLAILFEDKQTNQCQPDMFNRKLQI